MITRAPSYRTVVATVLLMASSLSWSGVAAQTPMAASTPTIPFSAPAQEEYRLEAQDKIDITVYQVKDLSLEKVQIDSAGNVFLPLIGVVPAAGRTPTQLAGDIADRLQGKYLQAPQVAVRVSEAASQKVTVDGAVIQPGVYVMSGRTTLLQAVAMAKGPDSRYADLKRVVVFRNVDGQRMAATYNLKDIRTGRAEDPEIKGNDVIVVDGSGTKRALREMLGALPALTIFRPF